MPTYDTEGSERYGSTRNDSDAGATIPPTRCGNSRKALEGCGSDTCDRHQRYGAEGAGTVRKDAERSRRWHELTDTTGTVRKGSKGVGGRGAGSNYRR